MLLAAGDAVVISEIFCPRRRVGCCYRQGSNLRAFTIHTDDIIIRGVDLTLQDSQSLRGNDAGGTISHTEQFHLVSVEAWSAGSLQCSGSVRLPTNVLPSVSHNASVLPVF